MAFVGKKTFTAAEVLSASDMNSLVTQTGAFLGTASTATAYTIGSADAWGHIGVNVGGKDITALTPGQKDKADPQGQRGYVGAKFYYNAVILNNLQMAVYEVATNALSA